MMVNDDDDDIVPDDDEETYEPERELPTRGSMLATRRRIEDLKEMRRIRELLEDDELMLDFD